MQETLYAGIEYSAAIEVERVPLFMIWIHIRYCKILLLNI